MKKILFVLVMAFTLASCSFLGKPKEDLVQKYSLNKESAHNWDTTISKVKISEAEMPDWYGEENPLINLRRHGRMSEKEYYFLDYLGKKPADQITDEDFNKFVDILNGYVKRMPRRFLLEETNSRLDNPSKYIKEVVADKEDWDKIVAWSQKDDLNTKDVKKLRKLLASFIKKDNFFEPSVWYQVEVSDRVAILARLAKKSPKTKLELNNINAKALYIAYPEYLSKIDRWER